MARESESQMITIALRLVVSKSMYIQVTILLAT
jgi:hypothetical protein